MLTATGTEMARPGGAALAAGIVFYDGYPQEQSAEPCADGRMPRVGLSSPQR
jgi:hypothetical protein